MINALKPAVFVLATALACFAAFANLSAAPPREPAQDSIGFRAIDSFLADSRKYLGL